MSATSTYFVYILASGRHGTLYIGVTNNLPFRLEQHRAGRGSKFVKQYGVYPPCLCRRVFVAARGNRTREAIEELAARLENPADRRE
jgi:predicted GIY-YIG superfamily endonuclease